MAFFLIEAYNHYIEVIGHSIGAGACANTKRENRVPEIKEDTPILRLLSWGDDNDYELDYLYLVINDIVRHGLSIELKPFYR